MPELSNKTAIITGGGSGIGKEIARQLANENTNVVIASRRQGVLENTAAELNAMQKGRVVPVVCDLRSREDITRTVTAAIENFGRIDFLVNNSGLGVQKSVLDCSDEEWDLVLDTNLRGTFLMTREVLPVMIRQRSGYIINIASQAAKHGYPQAAPYCASKFGILGFAESLQHEVRDYGIHVHSLCPALVQVPPPENEAGIAPGVLQVGDLASTVLFLLKQPGRVKFEDIGLYHF